MPDAGDGTRASLTSSIPSSSSHCSPYRTLRRRKRITLLKQKSSRSLRKRASIPFSEGVEISAPRSPRRDKVKRGSHVSSTASMGVDPPVRLGHPSRPYYTAIRKNMSRPNTPGLPNSASRTPSPIPPETTYTPRATKSLDCGERLAPVQNGFSLRPTSMVLPGQGVSGYPYAGFSLSGETELRMALARWRSQEAPDEPGEYRFRDMGRCDTKARMKGTVMKLGKGLKDLVLGRMQ
ncbi:hypothetical protein SERLA73DRAFT_182076 [Serpula lacrymans var. lacrymans S7.3]|uniref:Uncharacterized protein n=2 Tax=Serpula lacrymans var. lacrymans TaxID=341189 RepID=F8PZ84_SERL3|nr:uncharacterized protein SERLADRAFT_468559 [Serpula lacrymans var. lacrymans S7.9]EGN99197.1 hypothetical protein SERLA73DRAFT_182076 [Serpula lacrymans var. lacrymans S7.3]EGO24765.1 hypothetical protein SERLADRAFT_468559 [Serpula lacrymans var. lacrymans S7.9]